MSTRTALTIVGTVVGAYFGYPQLGMAIGALVGGAVDPTTIQGPKIGEVPAQTSIEGAPRTIVYGTYATYGNVIQTGPLVVTSGTETQDGKGSDTVVETQVAYRSYAIRVCEGPILGYLRIWEDNKLVYDVRPGTSPQMLAMSQAYASKLNFFYGTEDQVPSTFLQLTVNPDTPAYRGTAYVVFGLMDLTARRGSIPQYRFEVAGMATLSQSNLPLIVYPWVQGLNPVNTQNTHEFVYRGFASNSGSPEPYPRPGIPTRTDLALSLNDMFTGWNTDTDVSVPPSITTMYPIGWEHVGYSPDFYPLVPVTANQQQYMLIHYNEIVPSQYVAGPLDNSALPTPAPGGIGSGVHGANNVTASVSYLAPNQSGFGQWQNPDRNFSTETYTNENVGDNEVFYTYDGFIEAFRTPSPPTGSILIVGTAKQLAQVTYEGGFLIQNGLGPVLLPDDPNYNNADFWQDARDAAVDAGIMDPDLSYPVIVSEYASGYNMVAGEPIPLSSIVADIHQRCGIDASNYDVSELGDLVFGLGLAGAYTGADAINSIRPVYFFDKSEHDKKLWYPKRGAEVIETLTINELTEVPDNTRREQAIEIPKKLHFFYQHAGSGYARVKATTASSSPDLETTGEVTIEAPVVLNEDQAARTSDKMYKVTRAELDGTTEISVPLNVGAKYVPSNTIGLSLRGKTKRVRIDEMAYSDGVIRLKLKNDRQSAYTSHLTGVPIPAPTEPPSTIVGETIMSILDIPARTDNEDDLSYLVALSGASPAWYGGRYQRSLDGGANWTTVLDIKQASIIGELTQPVADASELFTDTTNQIHVHLYREGQEIESLTYQQFLSEGGGFAVESGGGVWEIMQYLDAHEDSNGDFVLSTLHRGLLNSGTSAHTAGQRFVMLTRPSHIPAQSAWLNQALTHRAISLGDSADNTDNDETETFVGRSQIEWPIAYLELNRDGADIITATWTPRHRFGSDDSPVASINFQGYRVTLDDGVLPAVTFDTTAANFTYDASGLGAPLTVSISALNRITGAGPTTSESI